MTPAEFRAWMVALDLNQSGASRRLGIARSTIADYLSGRYPIPLVVVLACAAVRAGLDQTSAISNTALSN